MIGRRRDARLYGFVVLEEGRHEGIARSRSHTVERSRSGRLSHWPVLPRPRLGGPAKVIVTLRLQAATCNSAEDWKSSIPAREAWGAGTKARGLSTVPPRLPTPAAELTTPNPASAPRPALEASVECVR